MKPPGSAEIFETTNSRYWFEGEVLNVVMIKAPQPDLETIKKQSQEFRDKLGGKKICAIMDVTDATASSKEAREYNSIQAPKIFKAIAFIITNPVSRMLAHIYLGVKPMPFPVKMFSKEDEAREWISRQL